MVRKKRLQLADEISADLSRRILEGEFAAGEWLRQAKIASEFDVSHIPVREALRHLERRGLVEHIPYRGVRVVEVSEHDAEDLFFIRVQLEGRAARFAALNMTEPEIMGLTKIRESISRSISEGEIARYQEQNRQFHEVILEGSRRPLLVRTLASLWSSYPSMLWPGYREKTRERLAQRFDDDEKEHDAILEALMMRDPQKAEACMRRHLEVSAKTLLSPTFPAEET